MKSSEATALPIGDITPQTAGEWLTLLAGVTGYAVSLTDEHFRLVWANDAFRQLTGYEPEEYLGRSPGELLNFVNADPDKHGHIKESFRTMRGQRFEGRVRRKDGREWWLDTDAR